MEEGSGLVLFDLNWREWEGRLRERCQGREALLPFTLAAGIKGFKKIIKARKVFYNRSLSFLLH